MLKKLKVNKDPECAQPHYLYDMSIQLPERQHKRLFFASGLAAANFLGVLPQRIYIHRKNKARIWSDKQNGWFAVRLAHQENTNNESVLSC